MFSSVLGILHFAIALPLFLLALWFLLEVLTALPRFSPAQERLDERGRTVVVVPAHNEEAGIAATVRDLLTQLRSGDRLLVVADNCTDRTAEIAGAEGAEVIERQNPAERGKGYALQYAIDALRDDPPQSVVFTDADCLHSPGLVSGLAAEAEATGQPVQALYLMRPDPSLPSPQLVAAYAWQQLNQVRALGLWRLAGTVRLAGAGEGFPWRLVETLDLASGEIVEDMALTIELAERGVKTRFAPQYRVESDLPVERTAATVQKARWEHGSLRLLRNKALPLLFMGLRTRSWARTALALDIFIPPVTIFTLLLSASVLIGFLLGSSLSLAISTLAFAAFVSAQVASWIVYGRKTVPLSRVSGLGLFLLSKLRIYGQEGTESSKAWTRTPRDRNTGAAE